MENPISGESYVLIKFISSQLLELSFDDYLKYLREKLLTSSCHPFVYLLLPHLGQGDSKLSAIPRY